MRLLQGKSRRWLAGLGVVVVAEFRHRPALRLKGARMRVCLTVLVAVAAGSAPVVVLAHGDPSGWLNAAKSINTFVYVNT